MSRSGRDENLKKKPSAANSREKFKKFVQIREIRGKGFEPSR